MPIQKFSYGLEQPYYNLIRLGHFVQSGHNPTTLHDGCEMVVQIVKLNSTKNVKVPWRVIRTKLKH